jgi:hypothetical protein
LHLAKINLGEDFFPASVRPIIFEEALAVGAAANGRD